MIQAALHLTAAALLCVLVGQSAPPIVVVALLLSLAPDLDTPKSLIGALCPPLSRRIERTVGHRTITHSLLALALVAGASYLLVPAYWPILAGAYASHLAVDLLIGIQGITLLWPSSASLTLAGWRNDGPAPRRLLLMVLPITLLATAWPQLHPLLAPTLDAAASVANPLATPTPTPATPTPVPPITLHLALPAGVGLSALRVHVGDTLHEGQLLARWEAATPIPQQSPTAPVPLPTPAAIPLPLTDSSVLRGVAEAAAALQALTTAQSAERAALLAAQQRQRADLQRRRDDAQRALDQLQPQHERTQAEAQHAVSQAHQAFLDAQAAASLADPADAPATQRATERVHAAAATLEAALDAQDRMRAEQGIERAAAETAGAQAQADLDALPAQQRQALATLDADQRAAQLLARTRIDSARSQANDSAQQQAHDQAQAEAAATAQAHTWQADVTATAQAHAEAATATAAALPTPAPNQLVSRASGRIVALSAEEQAGQLVVTLELVP